MEFTLRKEFNVSAETLYNAWLNSEEHTNMTGGKAIIGKLVGDRFSAWDGYITGTNLELKPSHSIIQSWRTTEFSKNDPDSLLELTFENISGRGRITLHHSNLEKDGLKYKEGWEEHYFEPMSDYFN